jgi:hypothetical protein
MRIGNESKKNKNKKRKLSVKGDKRKTSSIKTH